MAKVQKTLVVQVQKKENESPANLLKRFTRRVQESKILPHAKKNRFKARQESTLKKKKRTLYWDEKDESKNRKKIKKSESDFSESENEA